MINLIVGGSGSGKSDYAERLLEGSPSKIYLATMPRTRGNSNRIERHIRRRSEKNFVTIERTSDFSGADIPDGYDILLEDLPNLLANEMFMSDGTVASDAYERVKGDLSFLMNCADSLVIVSDDIFLSENEYDMFTEKYMQTLGQLHSWIAERGKLTEVTAGIAVAVPRL